MSALRAVPAPLAARTGVFANLFEAADIILSIPGTGPVPSGGAAMMRRAGRMLVEAIPSAFMAALYPPALLVVAYLLAGPRPAWSSLAYFAGAATITVAVGFAFVLFLHGTSIDDSRKHRTVPPTIDLA